MLIKIIHFFFLFIYSFDGNYSYILLVELFKEESLVFLLFKIRKICAFFYVAVLGKRQSKISVFYKSGNFRQSIEKWQP